MPDQPRLLARRSQYGYTDRPDLAMHNEPEAVSLDVQRDLSDRARRLALEEQRRRWRTLRSVLELQIEQLYATRLERPVERQVRVLRQQIERIDRLIEGGP